MKMNIKDGCIVVEIAKRYQHIFEERFTKLMNSSIYLFMKKNYELIDKNAVCVGQGIIGLSCTLIGVTNL